MLNVLIADSHPVARDGLHMLVERVVVGHGDECLIAYCDDALTAFRKAKRLQPDLILLSSNLHPSGGAHTVLALRAYAPRARLFVVSDDDAAALRDYLEAGADGVLSKRESPAAIEERLSKVLLELWHAAPT
jgi:DNA-binding NarL/FixJ family response regulator